MSQKTGKPNGRPKKIPATKFPQLVEDYLRVQKENKKPVLITGFCIYANISKDTLLAYEQSPLYVEPIKKLRLEAEHYLLNKGLTENKPVFPIFLLKANYSYVEASKIDITSNGETLGVIELPRK